MWDQKKNLINAYQRFVRTNGNQTATQLLKEVYRVTDGEWRGIGWVKNSFLEINKKYEEMDAYKYYNIKCNGNPIKEPNVCLCRDILLGNKTPEECLLFSNVCNPLNPHGTCMVSTEGACAIAYRYKEDM